jgi:hypothetical protein
MSNIHLRTLVKAAMAILIHNATNNAEGTTLN